MSQNTGPETDSRSPRTGSLNIPPASTPDMDAGRPPRPWLPHLVAVSLLVLLVPSVHDVKAALRPPYWLDEAWVAVSVRYPLSELPDLTASTPLGWSALLRLVPGEQRLRLLPLAFLALSVLTAYLLGQCVGWCSVWQRVLTGLATGAAVLLLPAQQVRHDLKQYTADAVMALLLLVMVAWAEQRWSTWRVVAIVPMTAVGMLVSHTTAIVVVSALGGLVLTWLARREWRRLMVTLVVAAVTAVVVLAVYLGVSSRGQTGGLEDYWAEYFTDPADLLGYLGRRLGEVEFYLGMPWPLMIVLAGAGITVLALLGRPATAAAAGLVPLLAIALGVADFYPLLDVRTSHYLLVLLAALAAIGAAGAAIGGIGLLNRSRRSTGAGGRQPAGSAARLPDWAVVVVAAGLVFGLVVGYAGANHRWLRFDGTDERPELTIAALRYDVRTAVRALDRRRAPQDVIVVSALGSYGFAMYWPDQPQGVVVNSRVAVGWQPAYPEESGIVIARDRDPVEIAAALDRAEALAARRGPGTRIWLVRSHINAAEQEIWASELADRTVRRHPSGPEPVVSIEGP